MAFTIPNTIEFESEITSAEHQQNYQAIQNDLNSNVIRADGSVVMGAELTLAGDPATSTGAATKAYVDSFEVPGIPKPFFGMVVPAEHVVCTGQSIPRASAPLQAAALAPDASSPFWIDATNFRLPDGQNRVFMGVGTIATTIGATGGSKDAVVVSHTHSTPAHVHTWTSPVDLVRRLASYVSGKYLAGYSANADGIIDGTTNGGGLQVENGGQVSANTPSGGSGTTGAATSGVSGTSKNLQPYIGCQWILRLF